MDTGNDTPFAFTPEQRLKIAGSFPKRVRDGNPDGIKWFIPFAEYQLGRYRSIGGMQALTDFWQQRGRLHKEATRLRKAAERVIGALKQEGYEPAADIEGMRRLRLNPNDENLSWGLGFDLYRLCVAVIWFIDGPAGDESATAYEPWRQRYPLLRGRSPALHTPLTANLQFAYRQVAGQKARGFQSVLDAIQEAYSQNRGPTDPSLPRLNADTLRKRRQRKQA